MTRKPTSQSVTDKSCRCGYLVRASEEPSIPFVFDEEMREYRITHQSPGGAYSIVHHCPWCGGVAPESKRRSFFAAITTEESERLQRLTSGLTTVEEAIAALGQPDEDDPQGTTVKTPGTETEAPRVKTYRMLTFRRLSETAEVDLIDYGAEGIGFSFRGKSLRKPTGSVRSGTS